MITVFTPTFNRARTLHRVWESLNSQTYRDFEWIVVDDGSTDDTLTRLHEYLAQASFPMSVHPSPENRGKHYAVNRGLELARGEFFIVADSDDAFTPDTLQVFLDTWYSIPEERRDEFCGVRAGCIDHLGRRVSDVGPEPYLDATMAEAVYRHRLLKESWCMVLTAVHRAFPYPDRLVRNYFPEGIIWKAMSRDRKLRFINATLRIFFREVDDISIQRGPKPPAKLAASKLEVIVDALNNDWRYFWDAPRIFVTYVVLFLIHFYYTPQRFEYLGRLHVPQRCLMLLLLLPGGLLHLAHRLGWKRLAGR
jgi:glycosyltransferase involved in cell wall biosynthesis